MSEKNIQRIAVIGNAGSGKSTFALQLQSLSGLPIYHLDKYFWKPGWVHPDFVEYSIIHDELCDREEWIIEGLNTRLLYYRFQQADIIIFLDIPRSVCIYRILKRMFRYYGKESPTAAPGCKEGLSWNFVRFIRWVWNFNDKKPTILHLLDIFSLEKPVHIVRSQKEIDMLLSNLKDQK